MNTNRRAYCKAVAGEILATHFDVTRNTTDFIRDERKTYDVELRPEMCEAPSYDSQVIAPGCDSYGYSLHTCTGCGYSFKDSYTPFAHTLTQWTVVEPATTQAEGTSESACDLCGKVFSRTDPILPEPPTEAPTLPPETAPAAGNVDQPDKTTDPLLPGLIIAVAACLVILIFVIRFTAKSYKGRYKR
jgi:hypothetical protein